MLRALLICCILAAPLARAGEKQFSERLSEADFKAAGLDKLTAEERARLDELVAANRSELAATQAPVAPPPPAPVPAVLRGKIAGTLQGWREGTVLVLEDGQRWRVISKGSYRAAPVRRSPKVELVRIEGGDYVMTIDTVRVPLQVRRVTE